MAALPKVMEEAEQAHKSPNRKRWMKKLSEKYGDDWSISSAVDSDIASLRISDVDDINTENRRMKSNSMSTDHSAVRTSSMSLSLGSNDRSEGGHDHDVDYRVEVHGGKQVEGYTVEVHGGEEVEGYTVEVLGGEEPPDEWRSLSEHKPSLSLESVDMDSQEENELDSKDYWKLTERDNDSLENDMRKVTQELNEASLASDEESLMRSPSASFSDQSQSSKQQRDPSDNADGLNKERRRISAPTSFPSDYSSIRSSNATERFAERMKSIEKMNTVKTRSRMAPVVATIGRFSSAFHRFEGQEEKKSSLDSSVSSIKAHHSTVSASLSVASSKTEGAGHKQQPVGRDPSDQQQTMRVPTHPNQHQLTSPVTSSHKKLPRIPYQPSSSPDLSTCEDEKEAKPNQQSLTSSSSSKSISARQQTTSVSSTSSQSKPKLTRLPVESSRLIRTAQGTSNAPDVVPAVVHSTDSYTSTQTYSQTSNNIQQLGSAIKFDMPNSGGTEYPHFDIDIVIKRDPLPADAIVSPKDYCRELPTAAITLSRDEVKVMKIDSSIVAAHRALSPVSTEEVMTVWDTEIPVRDHNEKVIPATKLHVTQLCRDIPSKFASSPQPNPMKVIVGRAPSMYATQHTTSQYQSRDETDHDQSVMVSIRPQHSKKSTSLQSQNPPRRSRSSDDILSPKMRTSLAFEPEVQHPTAAAETTTKRTNAIRANERAIPTRRNYSGPFSEIPKSKAGKHKREESSVIKSVMTSQYPVSRTISCSPARQLESEAPATTLQHQNIRLSSSLEDINQTGRVSDVKAIFSPEKDADKQYFGDCDDRPSSLRGPPIDHTRANTNTKQSSRTESTRPDAAVGTDQTWFMKSVPSPKSPTSLSVEDSSSSRERKLVHHGNPRRRPQGYLKVRSKSLGRTPSTTIAKMTDFFKEEAEQGASHRVASVISVDEVNEEYMQEHLKQPYYAEKVSTNSRDGRRERFEPQVKTSFTNQNSKKGNLASKHEGGRPANLLQADAVHRDDGEQPEVSANIGQFINMYNDIDSTSRYADPQRQLYAEKMVEAKRDKVVMSPTRQSVVDRSRTRMPAKSSPDRYAPSDRSYDYHMSRNRSPVERASHQSRLSLDDNMVSQVQELENEIDDRPLAASAFKAWLRTDNEGSSALEQNIETAYQRQTGQAEKGWNSTKVRHRSQPDKTKSVPWWKQQNQMSANQSVKRKEAPVHEEVTRRQAATTESTFQQFRVVEDRIDNRSIMKPPHQSPSRQSPPRSFLGRHSPPRQFSSNLSQPRQILPRQYPPEVNPPPQSPSPEIPSRIPQVPQDLISPYANYQLEYGNEQTDKADTSRPNDRPEDHYAQIRKVRPNDPQQVYVREASQQTEHQQQLHVNIVSGPPKPQRFYDDSRQTADQETMVDNQTYYDPYTNATETTQTEQHHQTSNNAYQQYADQQHDKRYGSADLLDSSHPNNPTNFQQQSATLPMTNNPSNWRYETEARHQIPVDYEVHQANPNTRPDSNLRYQSNVPQYDHREYPHSPTSSYPSNGQGRQLPSSYPDESYGQQPSNNYPAEAYRQPPTSNYSSEGYRQPPSSYPGEGHRQPSGINPGEGHRQPPNSHPGEGYRQPPRSYPGKSYSQQPVSTYQPQRQASYPDNRPHISTNQPADMTRISRPVSQRDHWRSATVDRHLGMRDPRHMTSNIRMTSSSDGIDRLDYNQRSNSLRHNAPQRYQNPRQIGHHGYQRQPDVQRIQKQDIPQRNAKSSRQRANQENDSGKQRGPKHSSGGKGRQQNRADGRSSQKSTASQEKNARQSGKSKGKPLKQNNDSAKAPRIEEPKRTPPSSFALPDFIPIQHVNPSLNNQQPEMMYSPQIRTDRPAESNSYNPYMNRARPGVSVMFNPLIGTTDF